jgi:hypothetical protein
VILFARGSVRWVARSMSLHPSPIIDVRNDHARWIGSLVSDYAKRPLQSLPVLVKTSLPCLTPRRLSMPSARLRISLLRPFMMMTSKQ